MIEADLILDGSYTPTYDEISDYINESARLLWLDMNAFIEEHFKASPKIFYSKCSGKPGWNVKYKRAGKSICTLYPEKEGFVTLVVITLDLVPLIEAMSNEFEPDILQLLRNGKPLNGTLWLMINVDKEAVLRNVKQLLILKSENKIKG